MLVSAMLRKRVFLGIVTALYGLAIFNLHYWGFGVRSSLSALGYWCGLPLQRDLREPPWVTRAPVPRDAQCRAGEVIGQVKPSLHSSGDSCEAAIGVKVREQAASR